jgi:hypothetical protein
MTFVVPFLISGVLLSRVLLSKVFMDTADYILQSNPSIMDIGEANWNACIGEENPFVSFSFLNALEKSGCVGEGTGWAPFHLSLTTPKSDKPLATMPLYLKSHSQGEYVFDHGWAEAYERAGGRYYPKLQSCSPFSPVTGPRLLGKRTEHKKALAQGLITLTTKQGLSGAHLTFLTDGDATILKNLGFLIRTDIQYHWQNEGYDTFKDFLSTMKSRKRKQILRERNEALQNGLTIEVLTGDEITEAHWDHYFQFYLETASKKWGHPYLNREFFSLIGQSMADKIVLMMCKRDGNYIAGALNLKSNDTLYGRYWGASEHHNFLHFELCYYQAIDYAIQNGLKLVEAGAQGQHKLSRGYLPTKTYSAHWLRDEGFKVAVEGFLERESKDVDWSKETLNEHGPFK